MPEVPDLEAIRGFLNERVVGESVVKAEVIIPVVLRIPRDDFIRLVTGDTIGEIQRLGKFLLFPFASGRVMVINPMLTGRFVYVEPNTKRRAKTCVVLDVSTGLDLRYGDDRLMGRIYLVAANELNTIPQFAEMGPDVLAPGLTEEVFAERIRRYNGMIKSILVNHRFVAGIGNAYSDEILWEAGIHPYRKRTQITPEEVRKLYAAMRSVFDWAIPIVAEKMSESLDYTEWRDHLRVDRKSTRLNSSHIQKSRMPSSA